MITAYLAGIVSLYEGEDIEIRYSIYEGEELVCKESVVTEYRKPAVVGQFALITLLKILKKYMKKEIVVIVNDTALYEFLKGTSATKNADVLKMAVKTRKQLARFDNLTIKDISRNHLELAKWNEELKS